MVPVVGLAPGAETGVEDLDPMHLQHAYGSDMHDNLHASKRSDVEIDDTYEVFDDEDDEEEEEAEEEDDDDDDVDVDDDFGGLMGDDDVDEL